MRDAVDEGASVDVAVAEGEGALAGYAAGAPLALVLLTPQRIIVVEDEEALAVGDAVGEVSSVLALVKLARILGE